MEAVKSCWEAFANPRFQRFESFFLNKAGEISLKARKWLKSLDLDLFGVFYVNSQKGLMSSPRMAETRRFARRLVPMRK